VGLTRSHQQTQFDEGGSLRPRADRDIDTFASQGKDERLANPSAQHTRFPKVELGYRRERIGTGRESTGGNVQQSGHTVRTAARTKRRPAPIDRRERACIDRWERANHSEKVYTGIPRLARLALHETERRSSEAGDV
jgi:hypothetical protein